jgi:hypothetical protein
MRTFLKFIYLNVFVIGIMIALHVYRLGQPPVFPVSKVIGKFAVCFSGSLRTFRRCAKSQHRFVISQFLEPPDIYLVLGNNETDSDIQYARDVYQPVQISFVSSVHSDNITPTSQKVLFEMYRKCLVGHKMACDSGKHYDGALRLRYDLLFWNTIPLACFQKDARMHMLYEGCASTMVYSRYANQMTDQLWCGPMTSVTSFLTNAVNICSHSSFPKMFMFAPMERVVIIALGETILWTMHIKGDFTILRTSNFFELIRGKWERKLDMLTYMWD